METKSELGPEHDQSLRLQPEPEPRVAKWAALECKILSRGHN